MLGAVVPCHKSRTDVSQGISTSDVSFAWYLNTERE